ncbi:MAG: hypothetical protein AAF653_12505 [Chloroflexota bacterium]
MTAQIPDKVYFNGSEYVLIGHKGENLPTPQDYGLNPIMWSTACYRGYVSTYSVREGGLYLASLHIGRLALDATWHPINGVEPETVYQEGYSKDPANPGQTITRHYEYGRIYNNLDLPTYFTGGILVGRVFIRELYVHMGFGKPYQYEEVVEFLFHEGTLTETIDHSGRAAKWREQVIAEREEQQRRIEELKAKGYTGKDLTDRLYGNSAPPGEDDMRRGIEWRFSLDYSDWFRE